MNAIDMSAFVAPKSDQLTADDLVGGPRTIVVTRVTGNASDAAQPVNVWFEGDDGKPFRPCKTIRRVMMHCWGADAAQYTGRAMTLFRDPKVEFGGMQVGGIRISHISHIDRKTLVPVQVRKGAKGGYEVLPLAAPPQDDPAAKWARSYIAAVEAAGDADALNAFANAKAGKLAELAQKRPLLAASCITALNTRREQLGDDWQENELTIDVGASAEPPYAGTVTEVMRLIDAGERDAAEALYREHMMALPSDVASEIEAALAASKVKAA